jgi:hypothetical protein
MNAQRAWLTVGVRLPATRHDPGFGVNLTLNRVCVKPE